MDSLTILSFTPVDHPLPRVRDGGFNLEHPYVELCWSAVIGPSSVMLLRRLPALWMVEVPAVIDAAELAGSLGLGSNTGPKSRLVNTLERLTRFGLATPVTDGSGLDVYRQVPILSPRQLSRVPRCTRDTHGRLVATHRSSLVEDGRTASSTLSIRSRIDRLQHAIPDHDCGLPRGLDR